ncbi:hypothetical protein HYV89_01770 [Candidatus Woesearchaeota archaeon]|nr:hypothetical protein [Candidatus Woesearchaeota archaeon]
MEKSIEIFCYYSECGRGNNLGDRNYVIDEKEKYYFCDSGCKAMWAVENSPDILMLGLREKGIEYLVTRNRIVEV